MVECKYYLSINNVIDRSTCYETATEARRAAKSVKGRKSYDSWSRNSPVHFSKYKNKLEKTKIKSERIGYL